MTHRPYPSPVRARHQLDRHVHYKEVPVVTLSPTSAALMRSLISAVRSVPLPGPAIHGLRPAAPSDPGSGM
jgi:hypothetical protein